MYGTNCKDNLMMWTHKTNFWVKYHSFEKIIVITHKSTSLDGINFFEYVLDIFINLWIIFTGNMPPPMGMRGGGASHLGVPSYGRRASSASVMHPKMPPMNKKGSIPNLGKRGSTSSGGGISGLVINPPKIVKVRTLWKTLMFHDFWPWL